MAHVLFVTSGFGMGHATRDVALWEAMAAVEPSLECTFASYGDGVKALEMNGIEAIDLGLSPLVKEFERVPRIGRLLMDRREHLDLVVSDEVLPALPLCEMLQLRAAYVTNWLANPRVERDAQYMMNADHILVCDLDDVFITPAWLQQPLSFVGPVCRSTVTCLPEPQQARRELGLPEDGPLIVATAGGGGDPDIWFFRVVAAALSELDRGLGILVLGSLARMFDFFQYRLPPNIRCLEFTPELLRYFAASNLVITRGGHSTLWELALIGVPSICIPHPPDLDPFNERYALAMERRGVTVVLQEKHVSPPSLRLAMQELLKPGGREHQMRESGRALRPQEGTRRAASTLLAMLER